MHIHHIYSSKSFEATMQDVRSAGLGVAGHAEYQLDGPPTLIALHEDAARPRIIALLLQFPYMVVLPDLSSSSGTVLSAAAVTALKTIYSGVTNTDTVKTAMQKIHDNVLPHKPAPSFNPAYFQ